MISPCEECGLMCTVRELMPRRVLCGFCYERRAELAANNANRTEAENAERLAITCDERASEVERLGCPAHMNPHRAEAKSLRDRARELKSKGTLL